MLGEIVQRRVEVIRHGYEQPPGASDLPLGARVWQDLESYGRLVVLGDDDLLAAHGGVDQAGQLGLGLVNVYLFQFISLLFHDIS